MKRKELTIKAIDGDFKLKKKLLYPWFIQKHFSAVRFDVYAVCAEVDGNGDLTDVQR